MPHVSPANAISHDVTTTKGKTTNFKNKNP